MLNQARYLDDVIKLLPALSLITTSIQVAVIWSRALNSGVVIAGIGEAPVLDDIPQEDFIGDLQFQETGGLQPSSISLPTGVDMEVRNKP